MNISSSRIKNGIIFGAGHGIGLELTRNLLKVNSTIQLIATYRDEQKASELIDLQNDADQRLILKKLDLTNENQIAELRTEIEEKKILFDIILNSVGILHNDELAPEKSLRSFDSKKFLKVIEVNCTPTALIAKHFKSLIPKETFTIFATLSAKVGSIDDNKLGGWYSYRASKAALNMIIKNISIEFERQKTSCAVVAIHPGTTDTDLSRPYSGRVKHKIHSASETADNILQLVENLTMQDSGCFKNWDGQEIPW